MLFAQEKEQGHHHQSHVVIPGLPAASLVFVHTRLVLGLLERTLDPVALSLHVGQSLQREFGRRITRAVLDRIWRADLAGHHQLPAARFALLSLKNPDLAPKGLDS